MQWWWLRWEAGNVMAALGVWRGVQRRTTGTEDESDREWRGGKEGAGLAADSSSSTLLKSSLWTMATGSV